MKDRKSKPSVRDLEIAYEKFGPRSDEFYQTVERLIKYVENRFIGDHVEEVFQKSYEKWLESLEYYEHKAPGKVNIASWIFQITRNQCSVHNYNVKKQSRHCDVMLLPHLEDSTYVRQKSVVFNKIKIINEDGIWSLPDEHPLLMHIHWENYKHG